MPLEVENNNNHINEANGISGTNQVHTYPLQVISPKNIMPVPSISLVLLHHVHIKKIWRNLQRKGVKKQGNL